MKSKNHTNPDKFELTLDLPAGPKGKGYLSFTILDSQERSLVKLSPNQVEMLLKFAAAREIDAQLDPLSRGWRAAQWIGQRLAYPLGNNAVRKSVGRINKNFRAALAATWSGHSIPDLLESERQTGIRIRWSLNINGPRELPPDDLDWDNPHPG